MARRPRSPRPSLPLGSLTQPGAAAGQSCGACGSTRTTSIQMSLTDGSPVQFTSCRSCSHKTWTQDGEPLDVPTVLEKTRKR